MSLESTESFSSSSAAEHSKEGTFTAGPEGFQLGKAPLKVVTGTQTTSNLNFEIKPGAIVAHRGSTVVFVCG